MTKDDQAVQEFVDCHAGIHKQLEQLGTLPGLLSPARQAQQTAENALEFFRAVVFEHHLDEERELFPVVLPAAAEDELANVSALVTRLLTDHREREGWPPLHRTLGQSHG